MKTSQLTNSFAMRGPLDGFHIDWHPGSLQDFLATKKRRAKDDRPASSFVQSMFNWFDQKSNKNYGKSFTDLYYALTDLSDEDSWHYVRPVGKGGYGCVAVFKKVDENGNTIDEVVIKTAACRERDQVNPFMITLSKEAAIMAQINDLNTECLVSLRQFKCYADALQYRYYLENCEFGDLHRLQLKYKAWRRYFPEYFLWHVFYWFAEAAHKFATGPFRRLGGLDFGQLILKPYLIHSDIKTSNIFLGQKSAKDSIGCDYPVPKIADFGLASAHDADDFFLNSATQQQKGTEIWYPPEIRFRELDTAPAFYPFRQGMNLSWYPDKGMHRITPAANVWALGAVMWTLTTGQDIGLLWSRVRDLLKRRSRQYKGEHIIDTIWTNRTPEYDHELRELIRDCLKFNLEERPTTEQLLSRARAGLEKRQGYEAELHAQNPDTTDARLRVYYEENQINSLPPGDADFVLDDAFWQDFVRDSMWHPDEWGALLPESIPSTLEPPKRWPLPLQIRFYDNMILARKKKAAAAMPTTVAGEVADLKRKIGDQSQPENYQGVKKTKYDVRPPPTVAPSMTAGGLDATRQPPSPHRIAQRPTIRKVGQPATIRGYVPGRLPPGRYQVRPAKTRANEPAAISAHTESPEMVDPMDTLPTFGAASPIQGGVDSDASKVHPRMPYEQVDYEME